MSGWDKLAKKERELWYNIEPDETDLKVLFNHIDKDLCWQICECTYNEIDNLTQCDPCEIITKEVDKTPCPVTIFKSSNNNDNYKAFYTFACYLHYNSKKTFPPDQPGRRHKFESGYYLLDFLEATTIQRFFTEKYYK